MRTVLTNKIGTTFRRRSFSRKGVTPKELVGWDLKSRRETGRVTGEKTPVDKKKETRPSPSGTTLKENWTHGSRILCPLRPSRDLLGRQTACEVVFPFGQPQELLSVLLFTFCYYER